MTSSANWLRRHGFRRATRDLWWRGDLCVWREGHARWSACHWKDNCYRMNLVVSSPMKAVSTAMAWPGLRLPTELRVFK